ncbi:MAG: MlaD family protein [Ferruginibacter sp.]
MHILKRLLFIIVLLQSLTGCFRKKDRLFIVFDRVDGLVEGSAVFNRGLTIGTVQKMDLWKNKVLVEIELDNNVKIPAQSGVTIKQSVLNPSIIDIEYYDTTAFLSNKDTLTGNFIKQGLMDNLLSDSAKRKNIEDAINKIADAIETINDKKTDSIKR